MNRYRNNNQIIKILKDYAVPLIGLALIFMLIIGIFMGGDTENELKQKTDVDVKSDELVSISFEDENTKSYIIYLNGKKELIKDDINLQKGEKIQVDEGKLSIVFPNKAKIKLGENGELVYQKNGNILINSGYAWIESFDNIEIYTKFTSISLEAFSIISIYETQLESRIYSLNGDIIVSNLSGLSTKLYSQEKISIKSKDSKTGDINLDTFKSELDDYFKLSNWFKENGGEDILSKNNNRDDLTMSGSFDEQNDFGEDLIYIEGLKDESYVKNSNINILGRYSPLNVGKITINNIEAKLNSELGTFSLNGFNLGSKINDLVIKIYDNNGNIIKKEILTIYTKNPSMNTGNINESLENFSVKATDFIIYEPTKTGKLVTTSSMVTIRGMVKNKDVANVQVNGYTLKSYNGKTWRYHAFVEQGTLKNGANKYEIKYLDKDGNIIYKEYYTIFKEYNNKSKISDEAKLN